MRLEGKVATITGGGRGIGAAICTAFAREGAAVIIADLNIDSARELADRLNKDGGKAEPFQMDVSDPEQAKALVSHALATFGALNIHVNDAGVILNELFLDTPLAGWEQVLRVNLTGAFLCGQAAAREMSKSGGGRIINITSLSAQKGGTGRSAYGASKAGLELLTKVMAVELAEYGINANAIAPGPIETDMAKHSHDQATRDAYAYLVPQRRYGAPEEVADAAVFLASAESSYINGQTINVDGGFFAAGLMFRKSNEQSHNR